MTIINTFKGEFLFIEILKESCYHKVINKKLVFMIHNNKPLEDTIEKIALPKANYIFICTTDTITKDILIDLEEYFSIEFFLAVNNLSPDKTYAICKKK